MEHKIKPTALVDSHIHLFNMRSLPIKAIIKQVPILKMIAGPISIILYALTDDLSLSFSKNLVEFNSEDTNDELIQWFNNKTQSNLLEILPTTFDSENNGEIKSNELLNALADLEEARAIEEDKNNNFNKDEFLTGFIESINQSAFVVSETNMAFKINIENYFSRALNWAFKKLGSAEVELELLQYIDTVHSILKFFKLMLSNEAKIYEDAIHGYGDFEVKFLVHHMMDMKASYTDGDTYYPFYPKQTENMMELVNFSNGKLIGFTAFNPKNINPLESVKNGLRAGNRGVKFYPPMGYRPYTDPDEGVKNNVSAFFKMCLDDDIPVFTHCTPIGFQAEKGFGLNCDPKYWKQLLEQPGNEKLRICFGHAGGGDAKINGNNVHGWYSSVNEWNDVNCYAKKVVELCQEYENVYCEVAYLDKILNDCTEKANFVENLKTNFNKGAKYHLKDKICFGTDWHMLGMINQQLNYANAFVQIFQDEALNNSIDDFFAENFIKFITTTKQT